MNNIDRLRKGLSPERKAEDRGTDRGDPEGGALVAGASPRS